MVTAMATMPHTEDSRPSDRPARIRVAGPVFAAEAISVTGFLSAAVKYSVSLPMIWVSTMPKKVARAASHQKLRQCQS